MGDFAGIGRTLFVCNLFLRCSFDPVMEDPSCFQPVVSTT
jgi:hypothetical protein